MAPEREGGIDGVLERRNPNVDPLRRKGLPRLPYRPPPGQVRDLLEAGRASGLEASLNASREGTFPALASSSACGSTVSAASTDCSTLPSPFAAFAAAPTAFCVAPWVIEPPTRVWATASNHSPSDTGGPSVPMASMPCRYASTIPSIPPNCSTTSLTTDGGSGGGAIVPASTFSPGWGRS